MVDAFHIKSGHITHDALHWPIDLHFRHEQVGKYPRWIASLLVPVVLGFALDSRNPTAFVGIGIGQDNLSVQPYLGVQPAIAVRWILPMVLLEQQDVAQKALFFARRLRKMFFPSVETAPLDAHCLAKKLHRNFSG